MRAANFTKLTTVLILGVVITFFTSCEKAKDILSTDSIVGTWTIQSSTIDVKINNQSVVDYIMAAMGMTREQAELFAQSYGADEVMTGTITFNADGTYSANINNDPDSGTYIMSSDGNTVTIDGGTEDEMIMNIITLTSSTLVVENAETEVMDLDQDGTDDTLSTVMRMTLTK